MNNFRIQTLCLVIGLAFGAAACNKADQDKGQTSPGSTSTSPGAPSSTTSPGTSGSTTSPSAPSSTTTTPGTPDSTTPPSTSGGGTGGTSGGTGR